jgi:hypothetical protein
LVRFGPGMFFIAATEAISLARAAGAIFPEAGLGAWI